MSAKHLSQDLIVKIAFILNVVLVLLTDFNLLVCLMVLASTYMIHLKTKDFFDKTNEYFCGTLTMYASEKKRLQYYLIDMAFWEGLVLMTFIYDLINP